MWRHLVFAALFTSLVSGCGKSLSSSTWPQFRGPDGSASALEQSVPDRFGPGVNVLWKREVPAGTSSPTVWGDRIYLTGYEGKTLQVISFRRSDGTIVWRKEFPMSGEEEFFHRDSSPAAPTICVDAERLYAYFGAYGLIALDHDGNVIWERAFPVEQNSFGTGTSPILDGDSLYLARDVAGLSAVYCLDVETGDERWMAPRPDAGPNYATPYVWRQPNHTEIVVGGTGTLRAYDSRTGEERWVVTNLPALICPSPIGAGDVLIFGGWTTANVPGPKKIATVFDLGTELPEDVHTDARRFVEYFDANKDGGIQETEFPESRIRDAFRYLDRNRNGAWDVDEVRAGITAPAAPGRNVLLAVRAGGRGDITESHVLWEQTKALPYVASPVIQDGRVYFVKKGGLISCVDLRTGKPYYQARRLGLGGEYYATPIVVGDRVIVAAERGAIFVLSNGDAFEVIARNELGEGIIATPAVVDNTLYVRSTGHLWAFGE